MKPRKSLILHPFLLAVFPPLFLYAENLGELFYSESIIPMLVTLVLSIGIWFILRIFITSRERAGLVLSCATLFIFSYLNFASSVISSFHLKLEHYSLFLIAAWFILLVMTLWIICRLKNSLVNWTKILNVISICLISFSLIKIVSILPENIATQRLRDSYVTHDEFLKPETIPENLPNIYYLVLDEHIGFPTMEQFEYDSSVLKSSLNERGFFVAEQSKSNYAFTVLSLPSSLNFKYLEIPTSESHNEKNFKPLYRLMDHNRVFQFLKSYGYTTIQCSTYIENDITWIESADEVLIHYPWYFSNLSLELFSNTPFYSLLTPLIAKQDEKDFTLKTLLHKRRIEKSFDEIERIADHESPFILYAHIMCPHGPFIYDENGDPPKDGKEFSGISVESYPAELQDGFRKYFAQMTYLDNKILQITDHIKKHSKQPPIIIVQGDHGFRYQIPKKKKYDQTDLPREAFPEIFSILNAYYLPGYDYSQLSDSITPVNTFRVIFNHYFKADFDILPNRYFFSFRKSNCDFREVQLQTNGE